MLNRRQFLIALAGMGTATCGRPIRREPGRNLAISRGRGTGTGLRGQTGEWVQPIWTGFGPPVMTSVPLLKVFHSVGAWRRFIAPLWPDHEERVGLETFDWSEWVLLLILAEPSGGMESRIVVRRVSREVDGEITVELEVEQDTAATPGLDVETQMSVIAKGARGVFRPDARLAVEIAGRKGTVTHY